jgi:putative colanic acid biosynthesis glycosyltransferase
MAISKKNNPIISIITIVLNEKKWLERTLDSVTSQTYNNIEFIIIDGGSTDGTLDVIKQYQDSIDYWVSEKDGGLYDALNKGLEVATGDFVNFMNAGDTIKDSKSLENIAHQLTNFKKSYYSRAIVLSDIGSWIYPPYNMSDSEKWLKFNLPNFQTMFFSKYIYESNRFDLRLELIADDDYKMVVIREGGLNFIDEEYVEFRRDGISSNHKSLSLFIQRVKESIVINLKYKRYIRLFLDPGKRLTTFLVHRFLGEKVFLKFIKIVKRV